MAEAPAVGGTERRVINERLLAAGDGLYLIGQVVAVYERERTLPADHRTHPGETFRYVEVSIATDAKVWSIEFFDAAAVEEVTGETVHGLAHKRIAVPVWSNRSGNTEYWHARRANGQQVGAAR